MGEHLRRAPAFASTGAAAGVVHWAVLLVLVRYGELAPLGANVLAWACAFVVSFAGHLRFTFADRLPDLPHGMWPRIWSRIWHGGWRFFVVSAAGFMINEAVFAGLLALHVHYALGVLAAMAAAAVSTYVLGAGWAFAEGKP